MELQICTDLKICLSWGMQHGLWGGCWADLLETVWRRTFWVQSSSWAAVDS
jgi:hypothetical protein